ncbi:MAG: sigma-70 family RNA polymerase sigma factor [Phycisphaerae bacterium]|nr:sigma-70 family RNA polymerase sigma factor [Gemmatimonadaceae bacterium]
MSDSPRPADQWVEQQYEELRRLAHAQLRRERTGHTLSTTGLVNEAYLRLAQQHSLQQLDRAEFFAAAAVTMRRILVDCARTRLRAKRGAGAETVPLDAVTEFLSVQEAEEFVALDEALERLRLVNPRGADVVQYRFFAGLSLEETATALAVSTKTVQRDWLTARAWLTKEISAVVSALDSE